MDIANVWLQSGLPASIRGARLTPIIHPRYENLAHREEGEQGEAYHLVQETHKREWILKKFKADRQLEHKHLVAIRSLVPRGISCMAAAKRLILAPEDLKAGDDLYSSPELAQWLQDTVLMPSVPGKSWNEVIVEIRKGVRTIPLFHRVGFAQSLANTVGALEDNGCAHRDLSQHNIFLDLQEYIVYLVDWDSLFHGSLSFHKSTPVGTEGYIAPWVRDKYEKWDARKSWNRKGDRFALAILIAELLLVDKDAPSYYDGALFSQEMYFNPGNPHLLRAREALAGFGESSGDLFYQALTATSYDDCPAPARWEEALSRIEAEAEPPASEVEAELEAGEEIISSSPPAEHPRRRSSLSGVHYLLILLIIAAAIALTELYQRHRHDRSLISLLPLQLQGKQKIAETPAAGQEIATEPTPEDVEEMPLGELGQEIPTVTVDSPENSAGQPREYNVKVKYSGNDLQMNVDNQDVRLSKENSTRLTIAPGEHSVTLTYTGIVKLPNGDRRPDTIPVPQTKKVLFGEGTNMVFHINRENKTWEIEQ